MQTIAGYYHYEFLEYFKELYLITFPQVLMFALLALFCRRCSATSSSPTAS
jgi:ABC-2 type transport system permease protein